MIGRPEITESRGDISRFMVHLTRNDTGEWDGAGACAAKNFGEIFRSLEIRALKAHCLHGPKVRLLSEKYRSKFEVACFTETPLDQIKHLVKPIAGRATQLEPFGFVFRSEFIKSLGGQQVTYVNSYEANSFVREGYDAIYQSAVNNNFRGKGWRILPHVSALNERCDFAWEREWRVVGSVKFAISDLVCVILPEDFHGPIRFGLAQRGIAVVSPEWSYEKMVESLSDQQRRTRRLKPPQPIKKKTLR